MHRSLLKSTSTGQNLLLGLMPNQLQLKQGGVGGPGGAYLRARPRATEGPAMPMEEQQFCGEGYSLQGGIRGAAEAANTGHTLLHRRSKL